MMLPRRRAVLAVVLLLGLRGLVPNGLARGVDQDGPSTPTFRAGITLVTVSATVRGKDDRLLTDLTRDDFRVSVAGRPVTIGAFDNQRLPLQLVVLFNTMNPDYREWYRKAGEAMIGNLDPVDHVSIGSYGRELAISPLHTNDAAVLRRILREELWFDGGPNPMASAVDRGIDRLEGRPGRRAVMVIGPDWRQWCAPGAPCVSVGDAERRALDIQAVVYGIRLPTDGLRLATRVGSEDRVVRGMARATGGGYATVPEADDSPRRA